MEVRPKNSKLKDLPEGLERFRFTYRHLKIVQGGIFLRKMPLGIEVSVRSRIENRCSRRRRLALATSSALSFRHRVAALAIDLNLEDYV
jgi:hypothetical protein